MRIARLSKAVHMGIGAFASPGLLFTASVTVLADRIPSGRIFGGLDIGRMKDGHVARSGDFNRLNGHAQADRWVGREILTVERHLGRGANDVGTAMGHLDHIRGVVTS